MNNPTAALRGELVRNALFALVDPARGKHVWQLLRDLPDQRRVCLFDQQDNPGIVAAYAPHLVQLDDVALAALAPLWGSSTLVFVVATAPLLELRKHFRRFLTVLVEGKPLYFRFYDPRVLPLFLDNADPQERATFFGPVERYLVEAEDGARTFTPR